MSAAFELNRLTELNPSSRKFRFTTFDIEAERGSWINYLMGGFYDGSEYVFCATLKELVETCLQNKYAGCIHYAHYGGGYDHRFILDFILKYRKDLKVNIIENHGLIMALDVYTYNRKKHWKFYDSFQVMKGGLDDLTVSFDVEHKKLSGTVDYENLTDTPEVREYLRHDVLGLYEVIEKFYSLPPLKGVGHKMTTSSLAMAIFRMNYLGDELLYKLTPEKEDFVRQGYYGGRNEIFKMAGVNVKEYDVNSMYPTAMLEPMPVGSKGAWGKAYNFKNPNIVGFIQAKVKTPASLKIPLLPYRYNGKLLFPAGTFEGVFYSKELEYAIDLGYEVEVIRALIFPCSTYLKDYAMDFYKLRQQYPGNNAMNVTAKLLLNGLYGKFAQERDREMLTTDIEFEEGCKNHYTLVFPEYNLWRKPSYTDSPAILPHISAAITAHSRIILHKYLNMYPDKVLYCDTDSVFIEDIDLPTGKALGELKLEQIYKRWIAIQPKFYYGAEPEIPNKNGEYRDKLRAKGFTFEQKDKEGNYIPLPWRYEDFKKALDTGNYSIFEQTGKKRLSKLREAMKNLDLLMLVQRRRSVKNKYMKRTVNRDYTTSPLNVQDLEDQENYKLFRREEVIYRSEYRKNFRAAIMSLGGIKPSPDFDFIPRWAKRIKGQALDTITAELKELGFIFEGADDLYNKLWEV